MKKFLLSIIILFTAFPANAKHLHPEKYYQDMLCKGKKEVFLNTRLRADCVTDIEAIEYEFPKKYREGIIQCLEYSMETTKQAKLVIIMENLEADQKYVDSALKVIKFYNLPVIIEPYKNCETGQSLNKADY